MILEVVRNDFCGVFLDETVLRPYDKFESLANQYKGDSDYYAEVSSTLGASAEELSASVQEITYNSEVVSEEAGNVLTSIETLQKNMEGFQV